MSMFNIIGGKYKGRKLLLPSRENTRPMRAKVREAIFSMINFVLPGSIILDAFAGSGSLSIESISRGAMKVIALENNQETLNVFRQNVKNLQIHNVDIINCDVLHYVTVNKQLQFDIIFLDPPFQEYDLTNKILEKIGNNHLINNNGLLIFHTDNPRMLKLPPNLTIQKQKKYGLNYILVLSKNL